MDNERSPPGRRRAFPSLSPGRRQTTPPRLLFRGDAIRCGLNLDLNADYCGSAAWISPSKIFTGWYAPGTGSAPLGGYDPDGYPNVGGPALSQGQLWNYPAGDYVLVWSGSGKLTVTSGQVTQALPDLANGSHQAKLTLAADAYVQLRIENGGVNGIYLLCPGYDPAKPETWSQIFRPEWLAHFKTLGNTCLRFMDWMGVNRLTPKTAHEVQADWSQWDQTSRNVSTDWMIRLANVELGGCDIWVNVPDTLIHGDDYSEVRKLAIRFLGVKGKVNVELSNELFNWGFPQRGRIEALADPAKYGDADINVRTARCAADLARQTINAFRDVLGSAKVCGVFAGQLMDVRWMTDALQWARTEPVGTFRQPQSGFDAIAIGFYAQIVNWQDTLVNGYFPTLTDYVKQDMATALHEHAALLQGEQLVAYEWGRQLYPLSPPPNGDISQDLVTQMQMRTEMGKLYTTMLDTMRDGGVTLAAHDSFLGKWSKWGYFGLLQSPAGPLTPSYQALADFKQT